MAPEERVFAKCAWRLIPFMVTLYVVNFLDRVNVGFAALTMNKDLGFSPAVFGFGAGLFFVGYFLCQIPANLILQRLGARRWIFCILAVWGVISMANAAVQGPSSFYVLRFLLGVAEAGFFPGMIFYLTLWFPRSYRARFTAGFMTAVPLANIIGAPVSGLILGMNGTSQLAGWQWLFLLEGLPAVILAFAVLRFLPDGPAAAPWLTGQEKETIAVRIAAEDSRTHHRLRRALRDPRVLALCPVGLGLSFGNYGVGLWLPQIVKGMGFTNLATGLVVAVPSIAGMIAMILWGRSSDRHGERVKHVAGAAALAAGSLVVASIAGSNLVILVALTFATIGIYAALPTFYSVPSMFLSGTAAAGGIALVNTFGTGLGGFLGPTIVGLLKQDTGGYAAGMLALALGLTVSATILLTMANRGKTVGEPLRSLP
ncbi:MAG TPA: MFS transporter [Micropepsaceae bacterium]|jgi:ACS family tartrate transporter-like MFS transporter|nr:MFS transporter [Micropepsaceae bacterium]